MLPVILFAIAAVITAYLGFRYYSLVFRAESK